MIYLMMKSEYIRNIFSLIILNNIVVATYSATKNDESNNPQTPSSLRKLFSLKRSKEEINAQDGGVDKRGRLVESNSSNPRAVNSNKWIEAQSEIIEKRKHENSNRRKLRAWTAEENEDLLYFFYTSMTKNYAGGKATDWNTIRDIWEKRHGDSRKTRLINHATYLVKKILAEIQPNRAGGIDWTRALNSDLLKDYFQTQKGTKSEHKYRLYQKWVREHPTMAHANADDLFFRAKEMIKIVKPQIQKDRSDEMRIYWEQNILRGTNQQPMQDVAGQQSGHGYFHQVGIHTPYGESTVYTDHPSSSYEQSHRPVGQLPDLNHGWTGSSTPHEESSHSHLNLDLTLSSLNVNHEPLDTSVELKTPSHKTHCHWNICVDRE